MTISQVSERYGLSADTLRYYERIHLIPAIERTASGIRNYTEEDCHWVEHIKCMRSAGVTVETLVEYVALFHRGASTIAKRKALLLQQREQIVERIEELNKVLERLDWKLEGYEERMLKCEHGLVCKK